MNPTDEVMRDFAVDGLNKEASNILDVICKDDKHDWRYNKKMDEVYCTGCGGLNGEYKGMGVMLMEILRMLKKK